MKLVYMYDDTPEHGFTGRKYVSDDHQLQAGETLVEPAKDKENFFNGNEWVAETITVYQVDSDGFLVAAVQRPNGTQLDDDERLDKPASRPVASKQPSPERQMIMQQQAQLAQLNQAKSQLESLAMKQQTALTQTRQLLMQQQLQLARLKGSK